MAGTIPALGERTTRWCRGGMRGLVVLGLILFSLPARLLAASPATDFFYRIRGGQVHITNYRGPGGDIIIPEMIEGRPVTRIESSRAWGKATRVVIPDSVIHIGEAAFQRASGLERITIGRNVTEIGDRAFSGCVRLERITLPESLAHVGAYAFFDCTGLRSIVFRGDAPEVGPEWLRGTDNVTLYRRARTKGWPARGEPWGGQPRVRRRISRYLLPWK